MLVSVSQLRRDQDVQLLPPGTQRPTWPLAAVQASCLTLVLATQQVPLATGRPWFWRAMMTPLSCGMAETRPAAARRRVARDSCILAVLSVGVELGVLFVLVTKMY